MAETFDVVVIGGGPAGENVAGRCAAGGLSAVLVERQLVGGECSYWGCIPSKTLIRPGDVVAAATRVPGAAAAVRGPIDTAAALAWRDRITHGWDDSSQVQWVENAGVTLVRGEGRLAGERAVEVVGPDGSVRRLEATKAVVLATGTTAAVPPIDGLREITVWDNRAVTAAKEVPRRLLVLGGGSIGAEMAQAFRRLGCEEVTIVEATPRLIGREEPFAGAEVQAAFEAEGMTVVVGVAMTTVRRADGDGPVVATLENGHVVSDEILVAVGRRPATTTLGLEVVGLEPGRSVEVDDRLRANGVPGEWLYAVGDCNGRALLTHMGKYQARTAADVILGKDAVDIADNGMVPRVTFTDPQVAAVGLTEAEARDKGIAVRAVDFSIGDIAGAAVRGEGVTGTAKIVVDEARGVIVGATFTGPEVQELLHSATVAVVGEVPLDRLWHAVPSYPTVSEVWLRLLETYGL
jgi:pyruvate/2-oxoglutarate dehydrogenase complex dihydrolipoamide dehydrogenase (E3) component